MPPALSDSEASDASDVESFATLPPARRDKKSNSADGNETSDSGQAKKRGRPKGTGHTNGSSVTSARASKKASDPIESSKEDEDEDDVVEEEGEEEEEEYEVMDILEHILDKKSGEPRFHVIWKGYPDPSDYTWEPEENLAENASDILNEYIAKIGGREKLFGKPKGKKRGRQPSAAAAATTIAKRPRKSEEHPADRETPTSTANKPFKPPAGSWEEHVTNVEMFRDSNGELIVCLSWVGGEKTQHSAKQTYMRCPQKILQFYESHISFRTDA